jgi:hypothetical protein
MNANVNNKGCVFHECVSSKRTLLLFLALTLLFAGLFVRNFFYTDHRGWGIAFGCFSLFFLFYIFNYCVLVIRVSEDELALKFGIFTWHIPLDNIETCFIDETSLWRIGGAGIHFSPIGGRYRAMFNFLEYERVVVCLRKKMGPVRDVAFSTMRVDEVMACLIGRNIDHNTRI